MDILGLGKRAVAPSRQSIGNEWIHAAGTTIKQGMGSPPAGWAPPSGAADFQCADCPVGEIDVHVGDTKRAADGLIAVLGGLAVAGAVAIAVLTARRGPA